MEFYPHNIPASVISFAVSASSAASASFINNFASITINTASLALNITGSPGTNGTNILTAPGPKGDTGDRGVTGPRGDNIFLLSSAWSGSACGGTPATCYGGFTLYNIGPGFDECGVSLGSGQYYSNGDNTVINSNTVGTADGKFLYTNNTCTTVAANVTVHNLQGVIFYVDGAGVITTTGCTS